MRRWIGGMAVAAALALGACAGATPDTPRTAAAPGEAQKEMNAASAALDRRDMTAVVRHGERAAAIAPTARLRSSALVMVAVAQWHLADRAGARATAERAIAADPTAWRPYHLRGLLRYDDRAYAAAVADFHQATVFDGTERDPLLWHVYAALAARQYGTAKASGDRLVALFPRDARHWVARGMAHENLGDKAAAAADYRRALALDARHEAARAGLTRVARAGPGAPARPVPPAVPPRLLDI
jgi:tetratricopeptide (TPR) repeat protein